RDRGRVRQGAGGRAHAALPRDHGGGAAAGGHLHRAARRRRAGPALPADRRAHAARARGGGPMRRLLFAVLVLSALGAVLVWLGEQGWGPVVITHEDEHKIVLFLGSPLSVRTEPGISLRPPFAEVRVFDRRYQYLNSEPQQMQTRDAERPVIDHYVMWRIADPLRFFSDFPQGMQQAEAQVDRIARSDVRDVVGQRTMQELVAEARGEILETITAQSAERLRAFGIEVGDVRINRVELPETTEENVFARMRAERERLARKYRAEGDEQGRRIRAEA